MSIPGDDAIQTLMGELWSQQGYDPPATTTLYAKDKKESSSPRDDSSDNDEQRRRNKEDLSDYQSTYKRRLPELPGYPDNSYKAGNHSIWNPFVSVLSNDDDDDDDDSFLKDAATMHTCLIPTNPQVEVIRRRAFEKCKENCSEVLQTLQRTKWNTMKLPIPAMLEKWHMDAKLSDFQKRKDMLEINLEKSQSGTQMPLLGTVADTYNALFLMESSRVGGKPFLPMENDPVLLGKYAAELFRDTLEPEVKKAWASCNSSDTTKQDLLPFNAGKKFEHVKKAFFKHICGASESFQQQLGQAVKVEQQMASMHGARRRGKFPKITHDTDADHYRVTFAGITLKLHSAYYDKLERLYDRAHAQRQQQENDGSFEEALFCLLCRYDMIQGAGLQAGVPGRVMDSLLESFDCRMECFASPLNCRYELFASAFDIDRKFGSLGSFFDLEDSFFAKGGCYEANPPFCEGVIKAMNGRIHHILEVNSSNPLMFVVFVPAWKESKAYQDGLLQNSFLVKHLKLPSGKHWYAEGTQHRRKDSFRPASFDTSILFYQNKSAEKRWEISESIISDLMRSFCDDPGRMDKTALKLAPARKRQAPSKAATAEVPDSNLAGKSGEDDPRVSEGKKKAKKRKKCGVEQSSPGGSKKRAWTDPREESSAQLELLQSLGISTKNGEEATIATKPKSVHTGTERKKNKNKV